VSLIDADTGEVVDRTPALRTSGPMTTIEVAHQCRQTEVWAGHCDDIPAIRDANAKLGAIGEYLTRTSNDGRALIAATQWRLEVRIGQLLGPASRNGGRRKDAARRIAGRL